MNDCEYQIQEYVKSLESAPCREIEDALEIMKIESLSTGETIGYIVVLATGGPHVEINTRDYTIECYWGNESRVYYLDRRTVDNIEQCIEDEYGL